MHKMQPPGVLKIGNTAGRTRFARLSSSPSRSELGLMVTAAHTNKQAPPQDVPSRLHRDLIHLDYLLLFGSSHIASRISKRVKF